MSLMRLVKITIASFLGALLLVPFLECSADAAMGDVSLELAQDTIEISTFYNGTTLEVSGDVAVDDDVVLLVSGPREEVHLKEKGKVAGFLWMNKKDVILENTPAVYMVYTPEGSSEKLVSTDLGTGYQALLSDISIMPESADKAFIFEEYVKLMEQSGVYAVHAASVQYGTPENGMKSFKVVLVIPSKMKAGTYSVEAIAVKGGVVIDRAQSGLILKLSGLPAVISSLAYERPLLFGFMAVFIAIATGLLIGVVFRGGGGAH